MRAKQSEKPKGSKLWLLKYARAKQSENPKASKLLTLRKCARAEQTEKPKGSKLWPSKNTRGRGEPSKYLRSTFSCTTGSSSVIFFWAIQSFLKATTFPGRTNSVQIYRRFVYHIYQLALFSCKCIPHMHHDIHSKHSSNAWALRLSRKGHLSIVRLPSIGRNTVDEIKTRQQSPNTACIHFDL